MSMLINNWTNNFLHNRCIAINQFYKFSINISFFKLENLIKTRTLLNSKIIIRSSSSDVYQHLRKKYSFKDIKEAKKLVNYLKVDEKKILLNLLAEELKELEPNYKAIAVQQSVKFWHLKQIFFINTIPFIGFGILDNMIMLLAGEYIDQTLGTLLGISTMAAAALGNIISDVAGVGLAHYVELLVTKLGFTQPDLSSKQLESKKVRFTVNIARAFGLVVGCLIGMFPLLFFKDDHKEK